MATSVKYYSRLNILITACFFILIMSCHSQDDKNASHHLLLIPIKGSSLIDHQDFDNRLTQITHKLQTTDNSNEVDNPLFIISQIWSEPYSRNTVASIEKTTGDSFDTYTAILIFDGIPDDDSVSGYRYDIKLKKDAKGVWQVTEARKSWRCWQDRGHRYFGIEPCA